MPKLTKKSYLLRTDGLTNPNYRKALLLKTFTCEVTLLPHSKYNRGEDIICLISVK